MMTIRTARISLFVAFILACVFGVATVAHAGTVQWSGWQSAYRDDGCYNDDGGCQIAQQTIQYRADAVNAGTGTSVCNSSVPIGTSVNFTFSPHTPSDFSWFYTGLWEDSPYGNWAPLSQAIIPTVIYNNVDGGTVPYYSGTGTVTSPYADASTNFAGFANPPVKSIAGLSSAFDCDSPDSSGSVSCTARHTGSATAAFNFAATWGAYVPSQVYVWGMDANSQYVNIYVSATDFIRNTATYYRYVLNYNAWNRTNYPQYASYYQDPTLEAYIQNTSGITMPFAVPAQSISCPISVTPPSNRPPSKPTVETSAQCTAGQDFSIGVTGTDPDSDRLYYQVYWLWDTDQSAFERIPATDTAPSGQLIATTHRYATSGAHTVAVKAVDTAGNVSPTSQVLSFSCASALPPPPTATLSQSAATTAVGQPFTVSWSSTNATSCTVQKRTPTGSVTNPWATGLSGSQGVTLSQTGTHHWWIDCTGAGGTAHQEMDHLVSCTPSTTYTCDGSSTIVSTTLSAQCTTSTNRTTCSTNPPYFCSAGAPTCLPVTSVINPSGELRVSPTLVRSGDTAKVFWSVANVATCTVTGDNPLHDTWTVLGTAANNWTSTAGTAGKVTGPITQRTTYTLSCTALDQSPAPVGGTATVNILPIFEEQ